MKIMNKILLSLFGIKKKRGDDLTPKGIVTTIVSREFEKDFKHWDKSVTQSNKSLRKIKYI